MKKTILNMKFELLILATKGYVAKTIGTAPLRPTQEIYNRRRNFIRKNSRLRNTAIGRPAIIKNPDINSPIPITEYTSDGLTSNPKVMKSKICINQAEPS